MRCAEANKDKVRPVADEETGLKVLREPQTPPEDTAETVEYARH